MDWIEEFIKKFNTHPMIPNLREIRYHGKLEIHFADGVANTCHLNWVVKPYGSVGITLKEGGKNE